MPEFAVMVKVVDVLVPEGTTDPVPIQPMHVQVTPLSITGLGTLQITEVPEL